MKEARIILPINDNHGASLAGVHNELKRTLAKTFGGYTAIASYGGWIDPADDAVYEEPGIAYDVAMEETEENAIKLRQIAVDAGLAAGQLAVFVRYAGGLVEIVDLSDRYPSAQIVA